MAGLLRHIERVLVDAALGDGAGTGDGAEGVAALGTVQ
jgi:hypothetical protein